MTDTASRAMHDAPTLQEHYDVLIVGAGLSGIDAAYRVQTMCPSKDYVVLEGRGSMGGTWDLFRYPGVRSDSDMYTLGFPFEPWTAEKSIADGQTILDYIKNTAAKYGIDKRIRFSHKVIGADWSSEHASWTVHISTPGGERTVSANFVYLCAGYYNYDHGYTPEFAGRDDFNGQIVHPQFWPEDLDTAGKQVVVIGSGATAVTLVPALVQEGAHVTMLQRSPTYMINQPAVDPIATALRRRLSPQRAYQLTRLKNARTSLGFYAFTRKQPKLAAALFRRMTMGQLKGSGIDERHFSPRYNPWDQRLCVVPSGDLFEALKSGNAQIVTDTIDRFVPEGVRTSSGQVIQADIIVTATGLSMLAGGGASLRVDGKDVDLGSRYIYRGMMLEGVPNAAMCVGYTNASWTLRADLSSQYFCTFINYVGMNNYAFGYPMTHEDMAGRPALDLSAGYVLRGIQGFPQQGDKDPWVFKQSWFADRKDFKRADIADGMAFVRPGERRSPNEDLHPSAIA